MKRFTRFLSAAAAFAMAGGGLAACGSDKKDGGLGGMSSASVSDKQVSAYLNEAARAAGPKARPMPRTQKLPEIDTRQASDGSYSIAITLNSVTVTGGVTTVIFTAKNAANGADDGNWQVGDFFFNGEYEIPVNDSGDKMKISNNGRADGVTVVDGKNQTVYRAAYDRSGKCLCSSNLTSVSIKPQKSYTFQVTFAGLPKDVKEVNVNIPGAGSFDNVKVTR